MFRKFFLTLLAVILCTISLTALATAADIPHESADLLRADRTVSLTKAPPDEKIQYRLQRILTITGWFTDLKVTSKEGVVTIKGRTDKLTHGQWAESLARDADEVVAVINEISLESGRWFDFSPAQKETEYLARRGMAFLPYLFTSIVVMLVFSLLSMFVARVSRETATRRMNNVLLVELISRLAALPVFVIGLYLVLRVCGLTGIAVTVLGGTGALGLVAGFAMKNILENYFSGVMLSLRNPYTTGDVIQVAGQKGVVQKLTTRGTILVDFDGNHIIIPNSTIYGNIIVNQSSNPKTRVTFALSVGFTDSTVRARKLIRQILNTTEGVLREPEPQVLLAEFMPGAVQLKIYFWIDSNLTSDLRLKSVVMEKVKDALLGENFSLPGEVQQMAFPQGIPHPGRVKPNDKEPSANDEAATGTGTGTATGTHSEHGELLREASKGRDLAHGNSLEIKGPNPPSGPAPS